MPIVLATWEAEAAESLGLSTGVVDCSALCYLGVHTKFGIHRATSWERGIPKKGWTGPGPETVLFHFVLFLIRTCWLSHRQMSSKTPAHFSLEASSHTTHKHANKIFICVAKTCVMVYFWNYFALCVCVCVCVIFILWEGVLISLSLSCALRNSCEWEKSK
jgi:hypothetical protein